MSLATQQIEHADGFGVAEPIHYTFPTVHRVTTSHHGRTLRILGDAVEHLRSSRMRATDPAQAAAMCDAMHLLGLKSREVFEEYATANLSRKPVTDWVMRQAVRVYGAA